MERFDPIRMEWYDPDFPRREPMKNEQEETDHELRRKRQEEAMKLLGRNGN